MSRSRITHESLLRLIASSSDDTSAPGARHLHSGGWGLRPVSATQLITGAPNWKLVWHEENAGSDKYRATVEANARDFGALYDVIW